MEKVIWLEVNFDSLLKFADNSFDDPLVCIQNLNEAAKYAETDEQKIELTLRYIKVYRRTSNNRALLDAVAKEIELSEKGEEFFRLDFGERKEVRSEFEDESVDYSELKKIAKIRGLLEDRKYDEAFSLLEKTDCTGDYAQPVIDAVSDALDADENFTLDRFVVPLLSLMATFPDQATMISLMLRGGPTTHSVMLESADFFLDEETDPNALCLYGMAFFKGGEPAIAERFFDRVVSIDPLDEDALYHLAVIGKLKRAEDGGKKYWRRYREVYGSGYIPAHILDEYFESDTDDVLVPFMLFPPKMLEEYSKILFLDNPKSELTDDYCQKLFEISLLAPVPATLTLLRLLDVPNGRDNLTECYKKILAASRAPQAVKDKALELLLYDGYEGRVTYVDDKRVVLATLVDAHMRSSSPWATVYRRVVCELFYVEEYVPIRCSTLISVIRKVGTKFRIGRSVDDEDFGVLATVVNYLHKIKSNADYARVLKEVGVGDIDEKSVYKYGVESLIVV